jgi:ribosomal protein S18 acetylase RimI-like enzyme
MREDDLNFAAGCTAVEGWLAETREDFEGFLRYDARGCLIAEWDGQRAGICMATRYGGKGFIGEMIIRKEFRSRAIGPVLFARAVEYLHKQGCISISLDAVPRAVLFYESFGFRKICRSLRFYHNLSGSQSPWVRAIDAADFSTVCSLDEQAFGADRSFFLYRRLAIYPDLANIQTSNGEIEGYIFGRRRGSIIWAGPWWAKKNTGHQEALLQGLALKAANAEIHLGVLELNTNAATVVRSLGFQEKPRASVRMVLGSVRDALGLSPELYAIGTPAKG